MAGRINRLTARTVATVTKPGRHADGGNLYLSVSKTGAKSWVFFYTRNARQRELGLGSTRDVPLSRARAIAATYRQAIAEGRDPAAPKQMSRTPTFGEVADEYVLTMRSRWSNGKHANEWETKLAKDVGALRGMMVDQITTESVLAVLKPIWPQKPESASRIRGRIETILDYATFKGHRAGDNPARWRGHLDHVLPQRPKHARGHHTALEIDALPRFMAQLRTVQTVAARALEVCILTAMRSGEVMAASWGEFDLERGVWTVPGLRMKARREHRVPLSRPAVTILEELAAQRLSEWVFPGAKERQHIGTTAFQRTLAHLQATATAHGFRSTFRDWAAERTGFAHEVCEMALAHVIESKSEAAYRRGDLLEKRRELMEAWASYCTASVP